MRWLLAWCALVCPALAGGGTWSVHVDVQMVALPLGAAARLTPELRRAEAFAAADAKVQAMLQSGEAVLLGWPMTEAVAGSDSISESAREIRYPTVFDVDGLPGFGVQPPPKTPTSGLLAPTAFETTNVGPSLQVKAAIEPDGAQLRLSLVAKYSRLAAMDPVIGARSERPNGRSLVQPRFVSWRIENSLEVASGHGVLLAQFIEQQPQPRMILFLLHASAKLRIPPSP